MQKKDGCALQKTSMPCISHLRKTKRFCCDENQLQICQSAKRKRVSPYQKDKEERIRWIISITQEKAQ